MIYAIITVVCACVILIVGQPYSHGAAYVNRAMLMVIFWTLVAAFLFYVFGVTIRDIIQW